MPNERLLINSSLDLTVVVPVRAAAVRAAAVAAAVVRAAAVAAGGCSGGRLLLHDELGQVLHRGQEESLSVVRNGKQLWEQKWRSRSSACMLRTAPVRAGAGDRGVTAPTPKPAGPHLQVLAHAVCEAAQADGGEEIDGEPHVARRVLRRGNSVFHNRVILASPWSTMLLECGMLPPIGRSTLNAVSTDAFHCASSAKSEETLPGSSQPK